jgi:hypothetical protein
MPNAGTCTAPNIETKILAALAESRIDLMNAKENEYDVALLRFRNAWWLLEDAKQIKCN